ncbi:MAG: PASTA domain-containing protein [Endomicrobia bacterium]|nr:PASTA domain-containing protein [Endomicrobiia bacterium]
MLKKILLVLLIFAVIGAAVYYSFNIIMNSVIHTKKEIVLPDVTGKSLVEAIEELSPLGLGVRKEGEEFNNNVPPGMVLRQAPPPGMNVREGKIIKVTISQGGEMIYVPDLKGQTVRAADITLRSSSLMIGEISKKYSVVREKGIVLSQDPPSGSAVDKDTVINLVISDGQPPAGTLLMPAFEGAKGIDAREWAIKAGITVEMKSEASSSSVMPGNVIRQYPEADSDLSKFDNVIFYIAAETKAEKPASEIVFNYTLPGTGGSKRIRLVLVDDNGERDILNAVRKPKEKISIPLQTSGNAVVKVYINKVFIEDVVLN